MTPATIAKGARRTLVQALPAVPAPTAAMLARLDPDQQDLLRKLTTEQIEYVPHPLFARPDCERRLFGERWDATWPGSASAPVSDDSAEGETATLSARQERAIFERFNYARYRVFKILEAANNKTLKPSVLDELLVWARRAHDLRCRIVQLNMPLVLAMAKRIHLNGVDFAELISEGNMALLRSVDKFDPMRGFKFSTYACRAILKSFSRVAMRTSRYRGRFPTEFDPSLERSDFQDRMREDQRGDCLEELQLILAQNLARLNDIEQTVIRERFSLDGPLPEGVKPKTLEQIGHLLGVTKERVRQIQNKALNKLRQTLEEEFLAS